MLLTRRMVNQILRNWRIPYVPAGLKEGLLEQFGNPYTDEDGHPHDYTEQDICEHLRKILRSYDGHYHDKEPESQDQSPAPWSAKSSYRSGHRMWAGRGQRE